MTSTMLHLLAKAMFQAKIGVRQRLTDKVFVPRGIGRGDEDGDPVDEDPHIQVEPIGILCVKAGVLLD